MSSFSVFALTKEADAVVDAGDSLRVLVAGLHVCWARHLVDIPNDHGPVATQN